MGSHTLQQLKKLSFDEVKELFETTMKRVNTFTLMESDDTVPKVVAGSSKIDAEQELNQESSKRQKIGEGSEPAKESKDELSQEQLQQLMIIVLEEGMNVEALQTKYPIIDWEVYTKDSRIFNSTEPTKDKERELWVELKRLFKPDDDDTLWKLQRYMHDPLKWRLYDTCVVHHVSTERGHDIFMLVKKNYPLTRAVMTLMLSNKLQVDEYSVMADELLRKTFILANRPRQGGLLGIKETKKRKQTARESSSRRITIKRKKQSTPSIPPPRDDQERDAIVEATLLSLTLHKTALLAEAQENIAKVQEKLDEEEIDKLVDGDEDDKSSASAFADSVLNDDGDDTRSKLEPMSHKEHPEHVSDDDDKQKNDEAIEKEKEVVEIVKETNVDDTSAKKHNEVVMEKEVVDMSGSQEIRKEQKQTPTPSPIRSPRNDLSSDKTISKELADTVTPTTATSSKTPSTTTRQKKSFIAKTRCLPGSIAGMCRRRGLIRSHITKFITREFFVENIKEVIQHCDKIVPELTVIKTNEMLKKEMPRLVKLAVNKDREVSPVDISGMVSKEFAAHGPKLIEELF
ncbi:hypothetical protein Tco_1145102 [Tanacetum coccineum]